MQHISTESKTKIKIQGKTARKARRAPPPPPPGRLWRTEMQFGKMLYLDEFRYLRVYKINDYVSREVGAQILIRNRPKPPKGGQKT